MNWAFWDSPTPYLVSGSVLLVVSLYRLFIVEKIRTWRIWFGFDQKGNPTVSLGTTILLISLFLLFLGLAPINP